MVAQSLLVVVTGNYGFELSRFVVNRRIMFSDIGAVYHTLAIDNLGFLDLPEEGILPGSLISIDCANLDGACAQTVYLYIRGPMLRLRKR